MKAARMMFWFICLFPSLISQSDFLSLSLPQLSNQPFYHFPISTSDPTLSAQNSIWILVFCPHLLQAVLSFSVDLASFNYLHEYVETFEGLSNVKQLSIIPAFTWSSGTINTPSWSGYKNGQGNLIGSNLETQTVHTFLRVTKNLSALEIFGRSRSSHLRGKPAVAQIDPDCVGGVSESYRSIKHLRLIGLDFRGQTPARVFSPFKNLKILSIDFPRLKDLVLFQADSSESVKVLHLPYYVVGPSGVPTSQYLEEDDMISTVLNKESPLIFNKSVCLRLP